jgi:uncharacterized membrane protein
MSAALKKWAVPVLAALGLADSTYLSVLHWMGEIPLCAGYAGCETVNTSQFAEVFGVPTAAFGMVISAAVLVVSLWRIRAEGRRWLYATLVLYALVLSSALFMAYLTGIEFVVLHAVCYWCLGMFAIVLANLLLLMRDIWITTASTAPA